MSDASTSIDMGGDAPPHDAAVTTLRMLSPTTGSWVTTHLPTLTWTLATGSSTAHVELAADAMFATTLASFDVSGDHATPPAPLAPGIVFWRVCVTSGCTPRDETWTFTVPRRTTAHDTFFGIRPDVDGDGDSDVIVGQPGSITIGTSNDGLIGVFTGGPGTLSPTATWNQPRAGHVLITPQYGRSVASVGSMLGTAGSAVLTGSAGNAYLTIPRLPFSLEPDDDMFGNGDASFAFSVAGAGDVDGDGNADVLIGLASDAPATMPGAFALVYYGGSPRASDGYGDTMGDPAEHFGRSISSAGDVNGDRLADVIVGAPGANRAYLFLGGPRPPSRTPLVIDGPASSHFGASVACAGDVDGDGLSDVIIGAPMIDRAYVLLGDATRGLALASRVELSAPGVTAAELGASVSGAGDVDGDGYGDVIVGAPSAANLLGAVYVFAGSASGIATSPSTTLTGTDPSGSDFARAVAGVGDIDLDGFDDIVVGIPGATMRRGAADVFRGAMGGIVTTRAFRLDGHDMGYVGFGSAIARAL